MFENRVASITGQWVIIIEFFFVILCKEWADMMNSHHKLNMCKILIRNKRMVAVCHIGSNKPIYKSQSIIFN